jgi:hypothetical protein
MYTSSAPAMTQVGCLVSSAGLASLAVAMFGLRHALVEMARMLPVLPGLAAGLTYFARILIRSAVASITIESAAVLIALGLYLLYQSGHERG